jgi:hypothetical protein
MLTCLLNVSVVALKQEERTRRGEKIEGRGWKRRSRNRAEE